MEIQSIKTNKRAIIAIHGWTGNVNSLKSLSKQWRYAETTWIFIEGPYSAEPKGFSWFKGNDEDGWEYDESFDILNHTIQSLIEDGYQYKHIYMLGFSQGACLAMEFMIRQKFSIGGVIAISGFIKNKSSFKESKNILSKDTQILLLHGQKDNTIDPKESTIAFKLFVDLGFKTGIHIFKGGHKIPLKAKKLIQEKILTDICI
ncbi:MAG: alpha/beta hydrolase [Candidatus Neomarinimicrobiota bacterium]